MRTVARASIYASLVLSLELELAIPESGTRIRSSFASPKLPALAAARPNAEKFHDMRMRLFPSSMREQAAAGLSAQELEDRKSSRAVSGRQTCD